MPTDRRYALITGAASGLGRALSLRLARDRWSLALADIDLDGAAETLRLVEEQGGVGRVERLDVSQADQWQTLRQRLAADWPRLDLLVNNAGVVAGGEVGELSLDDWRWVLGVTLEGVIFGCHTMTPWLKANPRGGHILNVASIAGLIALPSSAAYSVAKAGVISLSESLYAELKRHGVGVTVVCPGFFATGLLARGRFMQPRYREMGQGFVEHATLTADQVADAAVRAVARRRLYVVLPAKGRRWWWMKRLLPTFMTRAVAKQYDRDVSSPPDIG